MLRNEEIFNLIVLLITFVITMYMVILTLLDCYTQDLEKEKQYSILKNKKDIEKRINKMNRRKIK